MLAARSLGLLCTIWKPDDNNSRYSRATGHMIGPTTHHPPALQLIARLWYPHHSLNFIVATTLPKVVPESCQLAPEPWRAGGLDIALPISLYVLPGVPPSSMRVCRQPILHYMIVGHLRLSTAPFLVPIQCAPTSSSWRER